MQNFIFISPNFPTNYWQFCRELKNDGMNVLGIGDQPYDELKPELKDSLNEYYKVGSLENYDEVYRAVAFFIFKYGRIDWLESNNEYWLERDAALRTDFHITSGFQTEDMPRIKYKSKMKEYYRKAGIATARAEQLRPELAQNATSSQDNGANDKGAEPASGKDSQPSDTASDDATKQKPKEGPIAEKVPKNLDWKSFTYDEATGTCDARVLMIGDSVTAGAQSGIQAALPNAYIDGAVSRQFYAFQDVYAQDSANYDPSVVICALGTNGLIRDPQQVQDVINAVGGKPIYFVTVRVPLELQDRNNQMVRDVCAQNDNAGVIDWNGASEGHSEYLVDDGTHLPQAGIDTYAALIRQAICGH